MGKVTDALVGKKPSTPAPFDAQGAIQQDLQASRPNLSTPYGDLVWSQDDKGNWTSSINLTPESQALMDKLFSNAGSGLGTPVNTTQTGTDPRYAATGMNNQLNQAGGLVNQSSAGMSAALNRLNNLYATEFNYDSAPAMPTADDATRQRVEDALYARATSRLDPRFQQQESDLYNRLANQGITQGSAAYDREMLNFGQNKNDAYSSAMYDAIMFGGQEMKNQFDMGMDARRQGVSEANFLRLLPTIEAQALAGIHGGLVNNGLGLLNTRTNMNLAEDSSANSALNRELAARDQILEELLGGRAATDPNFNAQVAATGNSPVLDALLAQYQGTLNNYNTKMGARNNNLGALAGLAGAFIGSR